MSSPSTGLRRAVSASHFTWIVAWRLWNDARCATAALTTCMRDRSEVQGFSEGHAYAVTTFAARVSRTPIPNVFEAHTGRSASGSWAVLDLATSSLGRRSRRWDQSTARCWNCDRWTIFIRVSYFCSHLTVLALTLFAPRVRRAAARCVDWPRGLQPSSRLLPPTYKRSRLYCTYW